MLNDQHDKAIDAFIEVLKLDPETVELHFALGNLFRRRGEVGREPGHPQVAQQEAHQADRPQHVLRPLAEARQEFHRQ